GALILISHDRHLLRTTVDEFYLVNQRQVRAFNGDLGDYYQWLQEKDSSKGQINAENSQNLYREKKSLQNRMKKLEQQIACFQQDLSTLETRLADKSLYEEHQTGNLDLLLAQQKTL